MGGPEKYPNLAQFVLFELKSSIILLPFSHGAHSSIGSSGAKLVGEFQRGGGLGRESARKNNRIIYSAANFISEIHSQETVSL